jgi:glutamate transport system permease protein
LKIIMENLHVYARGWVITALLTVVSFTVAMMIGVALASARVSPVAPLRAVSRAYVELVRNTPLTVHMVLAFFGLPKLGIRFGPITTAIMVLSIYTGSFVGEILRAGINTIGKGQIEAGRAVGLSFGKLLRLIVLPQALKATVAPLGSQLSALVRNSAVAYTISVLDIMGRSDRLITDLARPIPILLGAALAYYTLTIPLAFGINAIDRKVRVAK